MAFDDVVRVALRQHGIDHRLALHLLAAVTSLPSRPELVYHPLQDHIGPLGRVHHPPFPPLQVHHLPQHRQEVTRVHPAELEHLLYRIHKLHGHRGLACFDSSAKVALPRDHPHDDVEGQLLQPRPHLHPRETINPCRGHLIEALHEEPHFLQPDGEGVGKAVWGKDFKHREAAEVAPVGAVRGVANGTATLEHNLGEEHAGAVGKDDVIPGKALLGHGWRGYDDHGAGSEGEGEDQAVAVGERLEGPVDRFFNKEEVADDRE
ncbi:hypothetical protein BT93_F0625 [Corymbia citriodora subsp. variegata]|nr:hypothetical protein BT93_F0625 [Corymbia citriodora subsp. variegata]